MYDYGFAYRVNSKQNICIDLDCNFRFSKWKANNKRHPWSYQIRSSWMTHSTNVTWRGTFIVSFLFIFFLIKVLHEYDFVSLLTVMLCFIIRLRFEKPRSYSQTVCKFCICEILNFVELFKVCTYLYEHLEGFEIISNWVNYREVCKWQRNKLSTKGIPHCFCAWITSKQTALITMKFRYSYMEVSVRISKNNNHLTFSRYYQCCY